MRVDDIGQMVQLQVGVLLNPPHARLTPIEMKKVMGAFVRGLSHIGSHLVMGDFSEFGGRLLVEIEIDQIRKFDFPLPKEIEGFCESRETGLCCDCLTCEDEAICHEHNVFR